MSYAYDQSVVVAAASADARAAFIRRTYAHLAGAILLFIALEALLLQIPGIETLVMGMRGLWIGVMLLFMAVSFGARALASSANSTSTQYMGLGLMVLGWAVMFLVLIHPVVYYFDDKTILPKAAIMTLGVFGGLTAAVLITKKDFSFLGPILAIAGFVALALIFAGAIFGFNLGLFFCFAMVAVACAAILYDTSNVLHHFRTDQHVAAAVELFASVAILFWYVLQIAMAGSNRN